VIAASKRRALLLASFDVEEIQAFRALIGIFSDARRAGLRGKSYESAALSHLMAMASLHPKLDDPDCLDKIAAVMAVGAGAG